MNRSCVRCGRAPHPGQAFPGCPDYVEPAPKRLIWANRLLAWFNRHR